MPSISNDAPMGNTQLQRQPKAVADPGGGGGDPNGGPGGFNPPSPGPPMSQTNPGLSNQYAGGGPITIGGGAQGGSFQRAGQSFSDPNRLQGAVGFWDAPTMQIGMQRGGADISNANPFVAAALNNFQQNVQPGIENSMNAMGLGRSTAALNAMARAQADMLTPLYGQAAQLNEADLNRAMGGAQFTLGLQQQEADRAQQGQQNLFNNLMQMQGYNQGQQLGAGQALFGMGQQAQSTGQQTFSNAYQDFLRQQGLSEAAINPFGGISNLMGTSTTGK